LKEKSASLIKANGKKRIRNNFMPMKFKIVFDTNTLFIYPGNDPLVDLFSSNMMDSVNFIKKHTIMDYYLNFKINNRGFIISCAWNKIIS